MIVNAKDSRALRSAIRVAIDDVIGEVSERRVKDLYKVSIYSKACADFWATNIAATGWTVKNRTSGNVIEPKTGHLLARIMADAKTHKVFRRAEISMRFFGWALIRKQRNAFGGVVGLEFVYPNLVTQDIDSEGLQGWHVFNDYLHESSPVDYIKRDDAIFLTEFDFDNEFNGVSSAEAAFLQASTEPEMAVTILYAFRNMMIPAMLIMGGDDKNAPGEDDAHEMAGWLERFTRGARNFGKVFVTPVRWAVERLQPVFKDVDFTPQYLQNRQMIAAAFNLSPSFIGIGDSHFNEAAGQYEAWQTRFYVPRVEGYGQEICEQLCDKDFPDCVVEPDFSKTLKEDAEKQYTLINNLATNGYITMAAAQRLLKQPVIKEYEDMLMVPGVGMVPRTEIPNLWKYRLLGSVGTVFGSQVVGEAYDLPVPQAPPAGGEGAPTAQLSAQGQVLWETPPARSLLNAPAQKTAFTGVMPYIPDAVYREMEIAARKCRKGADFIPALLPRSTVQYMRSMVEWGFDDDVMMLAAKAHYGRVMAAKAISGTHDKFIARVQALLDESVAGTVEKIRFNGRLRAYVRVAIREAYFDGLADGGVKVSTLNDDEEIWVDQWSAEQAQYIDALTETLWEDNRLTDDEIIGKSEIWWNKSIYPAYEEALMSAAGNMALKWVISVNRVEHCPDCVAMNGQVRRANDYKAKGILPKARILNCGGWNCGCEFVPTDEDIWESAWPVLVGPEKMAA